MGTLPFQYCLRTRLRVISYSSRLCTSDDIMTRRTRLDHNRLYEMAAQQAGYFTAEQARRGGFSGQLISWHVRGERLSSIRHRPGTDPDRDPPGTCMGAQPGMPTRDEVEAFARSRGL